MAPRLLDIQLVPAGPWRIGPDSGDRDRVDRIYHSDALYSAVTSAMARLGMLEEWLDATARAAEPAVWFSSCFPYQGEMRFVVPPRHLWPPPASSKVRWKGARFVPATVVQSLLESRAISDSDWVVDPASECLVPNGSAGPFRVSVRASAAVDRFGQGVSPHSTACLEFAPNAGLWLTVAFSNEEMGERWTGPVLGALRLLADSGFGGERSQGWGHATVIERKNGSTVLPAAKLPVSGETAPETGWWLLSLFHPAANEAVDWQRGSYALITRGGRVESNSGWGHAKRPTRMIAEGSVLVSPSELKGAAADVAPENFPHPVYRAGFALAIPVPLA